MLETLIAYLETVLLYAQKHTELFLKKVVVKMIWFILVFFTFFIGFAYLSFGIYESFGKFAGLDPILASLSTGSVFLLASFLFLKFLMSR